MADQDWEKRARELFRGNSVWFEGRRAEVVDLDCYAIPIALQLGREMADARAEEIAKAIQSQEVERVKSNPIGAAYLSAAADIARSFISKKKTREQVLEEALRRIRDGNYTNDRFPCDMAREALEWRGDA